MEKEARLQRRAAGSEAIVGYALAYFSGATTAFVDPSGAACIPGGLWPCGLSGGAPPDCVLIGPVQPCGCNWPLASGGVRPVLTVADPSFVRLLCATTPPEGNKVAAVRMIANIRTDHSFGQLDNNDYLRRMFQAFEF
jgi:hypothetical protein